MLINEPKKKGIYIYIYKHKHEERDTLFINILFYSKIKRYDVFIMNNIIKYNSLQ
jgi:uncharacterized protein YlbG (UPF0298 family)